MFLVDDIQLSAAVDCQPTLPTCLVDHPVVPAGSANAEIRDILEARARKDEVVTASTGMQLSIFVHGVFESRHPVTFKGQRLQYFQVPALPNQQELLSLAGNRADHIEDLRKEDDVGVDVSQKWAVILLATKLENGTDQGRAQFVQTHIRSMGEAVSLCRFSNTLFIPDDHHRYRISHCLPGAQCVVLDQAGVRISERLGGGKKGQVGRHCLPSTGSQARLGSSRVRIFRLSMPRSRFNLTDFSGLGRSCAINVVGFASAVR